MSICRKGDLDLQELIREVRASKRFGEAGGIGAFIGVVRSTSAEGEEVDHLEFEAYGDKVEDTLTKICNEIARRPGVVEVLIRHVVDVVQKGDLIMAVLVAGKSRKDVFPALIEAVERTKKEVPIWKKEILRSGSSHWVSDKQASQA